MQTHGGVEAEKAITASERKFLIRLDVDWDRNGTYNHALTSMGRYCSTISVDRALEGSAPQEIMLIEGSSSAELTFSFGGDYLGQPFSAVFSPYNGNSPMYLKELIGCELKYSIGVMLGPLGTVWYQQFVGNIRTIAPDRATGEVKVTALDRAEKLRQVIQFAPWAVSDRPSLGNSVNNQMLFSSWVIDNCLRLCDVSPTPYRPVYRAEMGVPDDSYDGTFFYLTGNGGWIPTIGFVDNVPVQEFQEDTSGIAIYKVGGPTHPLAAAPNRDPLGFQSIRGSTESTNRFWVSNRDRTKVDGTHFLALTLITTTAEDRWQWNNVARTEIYTVWIGSWTKLVVVVGDTGKIWTEVTDYLSVTTRTSNKVTIPVTGASQRVSVQWDLSSPTGTRAYVSCGTANLGGWHTLTDLPAPSTAFDPLKGLVEIERQVSASDYSYQFRNIYGASTTNESAGLAKYGAVVDYGLNKASYIPNRSAEAWEVLKAVAAAEMGSVFWDENGVFRFWTYDRLLSFQNSPVRTLSLDEISALSIEWSLDSVRNIWTTTTKKKRAVYKPPLYESTDANEFIVNGFSEKIFRIWVENGYSVHPFQLTRYRSSAAAPGTGVPVWDDTVNHGFIPQWWNGSAWAEENRNFGADVLAWFTETGEFLLRVSNGWPTACRFAFDDSNPRMRLAGTAIVDYGAEISTSIKDPDSVALYGARNLPLSGDFYQEEVFIQNVAPALLKRTSKPIPTTENISMAGDPRLQLGDVLNIVDPDGFGEQVKVQIYGINRTWELDRGLTDTLTVEALRTAGVGLWDSPQYGRWNQTFTWS